MANFRLTHDGNVPATLRPHSPRIARRAREAGTESMRLLRWFKAINRDARGNAIVVAAATLPLIIGAAAIGVDTIQVSVARRQLQRSADSAALAGAYAPHRRSP